MNCRKGFTLAEIMVVVVLLTIVSGAVFSLYSIGLRTSQIAGDKSEAVAGVRFVQKLLERKATVMAGDCYSTYMCKNAFLSNFMNKTLVADATLNNMIRVPFNSTDNIDYYTNIGVDDFGTYRFGDDYSFSTLGVLVKKMNDLGISNFRREDFKGPYLCEYSREVQLNELGKTSFDLRLTSNALTVLYVKCLVSDFTIRAERSATLSAGANAILDCSEIMSVTHTDYFRLRLMTPPANAGKILELVAMCSTWESPIVPMELDPGFPGDTAKKYGRDDYPNKVLPFKRHFFYPANAMADNCMFFYDVDDQNAVTNHVIYIIDDEIADENGKRLKQIRYCFCRFEKGKKIPEIGPVDDVLISGLVDPKFKYYNNKSDAAIVLDQNWKWHPGNEVAKVELNLDKYIGGNIINSRVSVDLDTSFEGEGR